MKALWAGQSLQLRVTLTVFSLITATVLIVAVITGQTSVNSTLRATELSSMQLLSQANSNVSYYIRDMESIVRVASKQPDILKFLLNDIAPHDNYSMYYQSISEVRAFLQNMSVIRDDIACITIVGARYNLSSSSRYTSAIDSYDFAGEPWYGRAVADPDSSIYLPPHTAGYLPVSTPPVVSLVRAIRLYDGGDTLGVIAIDLSTRVLDSICSGLALGQTGYVYIVNSAGEYIYHPSPYPASLPPSSGRPDDIYFSRVASGESSFIMKDSGGTKNLVLCSPLEGSDWTMVGIIPYAEIYQDAGRLRALLAGFGLLGAVLTALLLASLLRRMVFSRLNRLRDAMILAQDDLSIVYSDQRSDEIGSLGGSFNDMLSRIKSLMQDVITTEKEKRLAELAVLQSQINPHFLYNTLDTIVWMTETDPQGAADMTETLADYFRLTLSRGESVVTIRQELSHTRSYLHIQKIRYKSRFDYRVEAEDGVLGVLAPKLIVQPLVENAIYHGIKMCRRKCTLLIKAMADGGDVVIQVIDDGAGMDTGTLAGIQKSAGASSKPMGGVGVRNVDERIKLFYSESYGVNYYSIKDVGTVAEIRIAPELPTGIEIPAGS